MSGDQTTDVSVAVAAITAYLRLLPGAVNLGAEFAFGSEFRSKDWPHDAYGLLRTDVEAVLADREALLARLRAIEEAVWLWRDQTVGDVGLAIALGGILEAQMPEPPAVAALRAVLAECRAIVAERYGQHDEDDDGAREAVRRIRAAAGVVVPEPGPDPRCAAALKRFGPGAEDGA